MALALPRTSMNLKSIVRALACGVLLTGFPTVFAAAAPQQQIAELRREIVRHDELYHRQAAPEISDAEYDRLKERLATLEREQPEAAAGVAALAEIGDDRTGLFRTARHRERLLSLEKAYKETELRTFHTRLVKLLGRDDLAYVVEPKYDGLAVSLTYERGRLVRAVTRGNGIEGDDITANVVQIAGLTRELAGDPRPEVIEVRGEIYVPFDTFSRVNAAREAAGEPLFANPRNLAAGTVRQLDAQEVARRGLRLVCYGVGACEPRGVLPATQRELARRFRSWGLPAIDAFWPACGADEIVRAVAACGRARGVLAFPLDGAVVKLDSLALQGEVGAGENFPRWAMAYKFAPERAETKLLAITIQVGRTGVLTPVAELAPVQLAGSRISRATLHNRDEILRKDLRIGDTVYVEKAGEVIPAVVGVNLALRSPEAAAFAFPTNCPECRTPVEELVGEVAVRCGNAACPAQLRRRIEHFASKACVDIEGLGPAMVETLVARGWVADLPDLYRLRRANLLALGRHNEKSVDRLLAALERSKRAELWRVIYGLGLPQVGAAAAKELARKHRSLPALAEAAPNHRELIAALLAAGVQPVAPEGTKAGVAGKVFVLTGTLPSFTRAQAVASIEAAGGRVAGSVSRNTHYVVAGAEPGAKLDPAQTLGIAIIDEAGLRRLIGGQ